MSSFKPSPGSPSQEEMLEHVSRVSEETWGIWSKAHLAVQEAQDMRRTVQAQIEELSEDRQFRRRYRDGMLSKILRAAIASTHASMGNIQILNPRSGDLEIQVQEGFQNPFLEHFGFVKPGSAACGKSMESRARVVVEDVTDSEVFAGDPDMEVLLDAGVRAVQSTPLIGTKGQLLGVFSTHYPIPTRPNSAELRNLDYFAKWAAALIEWHDKEGLSNSLPLSRQFLHPG